jgi:hypothetical protein
MASSGKITTAVVDNTSFWVKWALLNQNVNTNKSTISWSCGVSPGHQYYTNAIKMSAVTINGTKVYDGGTYSNITDYKDRTFASGTLEIAHDSDGSKTFAVAAFTGQIYDGSGGYLTASAAAQSFALTTIPRASSVATSGRTLGSVVKITITRASTAFTHKLYYTCGSIKKQSIATGVATSYDWTPPVSLAKQAPNATTVAATLTVDTYNGGTYIGTTTAQFSLAVPSSVVPTLSVALSDPTGRKTTYGGYVQLRSKVKTVITASGAQGSTIKAYNIKVGTFYAATTASGTTGFLPGSGTVAVTCKVTDSRGRTASKTQNITVLAYSKPTITAISAARCNQDGTANRSGTYGKVTFTGAITSLSSKNTAAYTVQYREVGATTWTSAGNAATGNFAPKNVSVVFAAEQNKRYEVRVVATDAFEGIGSSIRNLPASFVLQHLAKSLLSIGIGRFCDKSRALQIGLNTYIDGELHANQHLFMGGNATTDNGSNIHFKTTNVATNVHNVRIYGGVGASTTALGVYDAKNEKSIASYDDVSGKLTLLGFAPANITISASGSYLKNFSSTAKHISALSMGILRVYGETNVAMPAGTTYDVATIGDHIPTSTYALSVYSLKNMDVRLSTSGTIQIRPKEDIPAGYGIYIAGIWIAS